MGADFRFIHCADLHLGSRFAGISKNDRELGRRMTESTFASFGRIVDLSIDRKADFMVISGDVYDEQNETPRTRYRFAKELDRAGIPCFISLGNHDFKRSWENSIPYPDNVTVFPAESTSKLLSIGGEEIEVIGRSFSTRHTSENLAGSLRGSQGMFTVGVVHCDLDSTSGDSDYAPCRLDDLMNRGVDYWALGHIHKRSVRHECPYVVYPGNIQGRSTKESGEKGAYVVTVRGGAVSKMDFVPTQDILWQDLTIEIDGKIMRDVENEISVKSRRGSMLSLTFKGRGDLDSPLRLGLDGMLEQIAQATGCIISCAEVNTRPNMDLESMYGRNDMLSKIISESERSASLSKDEIISMICTTKKSAEIRSVFESMDIDELRSMVSDAEMLLLEKLTEGSR